MINSDLELAIKKNIGGKLRALRRNRRMRLKDLSKVSGLSMATISRIETGHIIGTIKAHKAVAKAFNMGLADFYLGLEDEIDRPKQEKQDEPTVYSHNKKVSHNILTGSLLNKKMMAQKISIAPGASTAQEKASPDSEKFIYILEGAVEAAIGDNKYNLKKFDALHFNSNTPHSFKNISKQNAEIFCALTPPQV